MKVNQKTDSKWLLGERGEIYRMPRNGDVYQCRVWLPTERKYLRRSLKTTDYETAIGRGEKLILETHSDISSGIIIEFIGDACNMLELFKEGDEVIVNFSLKGVEWINPEGKKVYFKFIRANKIQKIVKAFGDFEKLNLSHFLIDLNKNLN